MGLIWRKVHSGFSSYSTAEEVTQGVDATGLVAIVTGGSAGIGAETARVLALRGAHVVLPVRNTAAGENVKKAICKEIPGAKIDVMEMDLSSMASVKNFVAQFKSKGLPLNLLINNAGISYTPFKLSVDGIEMQFATNHLGHFLLTNLLLDTMKETSSKNNKEGRIVNVSSIAHAVPIGIHFDKMNNKSSYHGGLAYCRSKLANVLHATELARRLEEEGANVTANSLHPGVVRTNILNHKLIMKTIIGKMWRMLMKDIHQVINELASTSFV
uniref:Short-chain dehydrogenase TIC 32, chloroplastic-like n=1 Tax=Kalanchoe fedtschenkoi TaxID=63787 RepID=A0A7N0TYP7_KALFE